MQGMGDQHDRLALSAEAEDRVLEQRLADVGINGAERIVEELMYSSRRVRRR